MIVLVELCVEKHSLGLISESLLVVQSFLELDTILLFLKLVELININD